MKRILLEIRSGSRFNHAAGVLLAAAILACLLLVLLGLWLLFAVAITFVALLAIFRAFVPGRPRDWPIVVKRSSVDNSADTNGTRHP